MFFLVILKNQIFRLFDKERQEIAPGPYLLFWVRFFMSDIGKYKCIAKSRKRALSRKDRM